MKKWRKILGSLLIVAIVIYGYRRWTEHRPRVSVEEIRRPLRQQGFRTELSDFNFTSPADTSARASAIISAGQAVRTLHNVDELQLMETVGTNVALAISSVAIIESYQTTNLWPLVKKELSDHDKELDRACAALLAGPVQFQPTI